MSSIAKRPNGKWRARYRDVAGKEHARHFARKVDAQRWLDEVTADLLTGRYVDPRAGTITLSQHCARWLAGQTFDASTRSTMEGRIRVHVDPHIGDLQLRDLLPSTIQGWVKGRQSEVSGSYTRILLGNLHTMLAAAVDDGLIAVNPCASRSVKAPSADRRKVVPWTPDRVQAVVDGHPPTLRAAPVVGAGCGLRQGEVFGLAVDAVDWLRRTVHVRQQVRIVDRHLMFAPPKGGRERDVPLPDAVAVALSEHLRVRPAVEVTLPWRDLDGPARTADLMFVNRDGGPLTAGYYLYHGWAPALAHAGVPRGRGNGFHALRHHYASVLLDAGVSIAAIADYLGHSDPGFTLRTYAHLMPASEDRARSAIDAVFDAAADSVRTGDGGVS